MTKTTSFGKGTFALAACVLTLSLSACMKIPDSELQNEGGQNTNMSANNVETGGIGNPDENAQNQPAFLGTTYSTQAPSKQKYYFGFDNDNVHGAYQPSLEAQAKYLIAHPEMRIRLEGNTDSRGSREYNIALGERRAQSVENVLLEVYHVKANQVSVVSYGEERPAALGHTETAYRLNRRVDLIWTKK